MASSGSRQASRGDDNAYDYIVALGDAPNFVLGAWHTVAFVFDGTTVTTCSDGSWLSTVEYVPAHTLTERLSVGGTSIPGGWDGLIDDLRIWDRTLEPVCK